MQRFGTVLVFKKGTTKEQAEEALKSIQSVLDENYWMASYPRDSKGICTTVSFRVEEYDDRLGGPVWYLP